MFDLKTFDPNISQVIKGLTFKQYSEIPGYNSSGVKKFSNCQEAYRREYISGIKLPISKSMLIGKALDGLIFDGENSIDFNNLISQKVLKNGTVTIKETVNSQRVRDCKKELERSPCFPTFKKENTQVCLYVKMGGISYKGLIDYLDEENHFIGDLKSTGNITRFKPDWYFSQLSFYQWLYEEITGERLNGRLYVVDTGVIQKSIFYEISSDVLLAQRGSMWTIVGKIEEAKKSNKWDHAIRSGDENDKCLSCGHYTDCKYSVLNKYVQVG